MNVAMMIKKVANSWGNYHVSTLSAALAYYTLFSLTPILLISLHLLVLFLNEEQVKHQLFNHIKDLVGSGTSNQIQLMVEHASKPKTGIWAQAIGWILLIVGSSALFSEIQSGLNRIWGVRADPNKPWSTYIKNRFWSFIMVLVVALLLLSTFILSVSLTAMTTFINQYLNIGSFEIIFLHALSFFIAVLLFAMIFKILPDVKIKWRNVWVGAFMTTLLFTIGKYILGIYFSKLQIATMYGAAGSLIILLIWVYYSAQIFFIGAIITKVISIHEKEIIKPKAHAEVVDPKTATPNRENK